MVLDLTHTPGLANALTSGLALAQKEARLVPLGGRPSDFERARGPRALFRPDKHVGDESGQSSTPNRARLRTRVHSPASRGLELGGPDRLSWSSGLQPTKRDHELPGEAVGPEYSDA